MPSFDLPTRFNPYMDDFLTNCSCASCEEARRNFYIWEQKHNDEQEKIDMPCMNCSKTIKNGTGLRFGNGKVCDDCLNPQAHELFRHDTDTIFVSATVPYNEEAYGFRYFYAYDDEAANRVAARESACVYIDHDVLLSNIEVETRAIATLGDIKVSNCNLKSTRLYFYKKGFKVHFNDGTYGYDNTINAQNQVTSGIIELDGYRTEYLGLDCNLNGTSYDINIQGSTIEYINCKSKLTVSYNIVDSHINELNLPLVVNGFKGNNATIDRAKCKYNTIFDNVDLKNSQIKFYQVYNILAGSGSFTNCTIMIPEKMLAASRYQFYDCTFIEIPKGMICTVCTELIDDDETPVRHKDKFMHNRCIEQQSHYEKNERMVGKKVKLPPFSFELEMEYSPEYTYNELRRRTYSPDKTQKYQETILDGIVNGFRRCGDCTVTDELKSVIMNNDIELLTILPYLQEAQEFVGANCGTHIHVGMVQKAREFYRAQTFLFKSLVDFMKNDRELTIKLWGRFFSSYASDYYSGDRYYWINFYSSSPTCEFRLAKLTNPTQFRQLVQFVRVFTRYLQSRAKSYGYRMLDNEQADRLSEEILAFYKRYTEKRSHALIRREKLYV